MGWEHIWFRVDNLIRGNQEPIVVGLKTQEEGDNDTLTQMQPTQIQEDNNF